jgi:hypothetical protein
MSGSGPGDQRFDIGSRRWRFSSAILIAAVGCSAAVKTRAPSAQVIADLRGDELAPLAAGAGFVLTGRRLTAWRPRQLGDRRSVNDLPAAIAISSDGRACATAAAAPGLGLRSYGLPGLEPIAQRSDACNERVEISADGTLVACLERRTDAEALGSFLRVFSFPELEPVTSVGPITESVDALSFVGATNQLAIITTLLDRSSGSATFRSHVDLYDARRGVVTGEFSRPGRFPYLAFAARADVFIWAGEEGAEAWSARSFVKVRSFAATAHAIAVALSPDGHAAAVSRRNGGGEIQIFDPQSGERRFAFGSAQLHAAVSAEDPMALPLSEQVRVGFVFLGATAGKDGRVVVRDWFMRPGYTAEHARLAFADDQTLASTGHSFLALWTLPQR